MATRERAHPSVLPFIKYATRVLQNSVSGTDSNDITSLKFQNVPLDHICKLELTTYIKATSANAIVWAENSDTPDYTAESAIVENRVNDTGGVGVLSTSVSEPFLSTSNTITFYTTSFADADDILYQGSTKATLYVYPKGSLIEDVSLI